MKARRLLLAMAAAAVALLVLSALVAANTGDITLISQTTGGTTGNGSSSVPDASPDGLFVAFISSAANLTGGAGTGQAILRDVAAGTTTLVSVAPDGTTPANAAAGEVSVSDDGTKVAFQTRATNLVAGVTTGGIDRSYVRNLSTGTTTLVTPGNDDGAIEPDLSGDGSTVAFASHAHYDGLNSVSIQTYVRTGTDAPRAVSTGMTDADHPSISQSGRFVAVHGQEAGIASPQVYIRDMSVAQTPALVSRTSGASGDPGSTESLEPAISADGRYVAFRSGAENLSDADNPAATTDDIYERDTVADTTVLVSRADGAAGRASTKNSSSAALSSDGRRVLFSSADLGLAPVAATGQSAAAYVRDLDTGTTTLQTVKADGTAATSGTVNGTAMAGNGLFAVFGTSSSLITGVSGTQVYRRDLGSPPPPPPPPAVSIGDAGAVTEGNPGDVTRLTFPVTLSGTSAQPVTVAFNTVDGTAAGGSDFHAASGTLVFDPGQTSKAISIDVVGDADYEADESFQVAIHDAVNAVVSRAAGTGTITNDDAQPPTSVTPPGPSVTPQGPAPTSGPAKADCGTQISHGLAHLTGCFSGDTAKGKVVMNGLLITPDAPGTTVTTTASKISSSGSVTVTAGDVTVSKGTLSLDPQKPAGVTAGTLTPPAGATVYGLPIQPTMALAWGQGSVLLTGAVSPSFGKVGGTSLKLTMPVDETAGLHRDKLAAGAPASLFGGLLASDLLFTFTPAANQWKGSVTFKSPVLGTLKIAAALNGTTGGLIGGGLNVFDKVVRNVVKVKSLSVQLLTDPLRVEGTAAAVAGPLDLFAFDGSVRDDLSSGKVTVNGTGKLFGIGFPLKNLVLFGPGIGGGFNGGLAGGLAGGSFDEVFSSGGDFSTSLPAGSTSPSMTLPPMGFGMGGGLLGGGLGGFFLSGNGSGKAKILGVDVGTQVFFSEQGYGGCGQVGPINVGFAVHWNPFKFDLMGPFVCDVGTFKATASVAQAGGARTVALGKGKQLLRLTGDTAPPQVTLTGPGGLTVVGPASDQPPLVTSQATVLRDVNTNTTYIGLADGGGGSWTITPAAGSAAITGVDAAQMLPAPKVTAKVTGKGAKRVLRWKANGPAGQHLLFDEHGAGFTVRLGNVTGHQGALRFTPRPGGGKRTITALVLQNGSPRARPTVASYTAPKAKSNGRVKRLKATLKGARVTATWSKVPGAAQYLVTVTARGIKQAVLAGAKKHALAIPLIAAPKTAAVTVTAIDAAGRRGPARKATARP